MRLNLGGGNVPVSGFTSVDLDEGADIVGDFLEMTFEGVEAVEMSHVLEHIGFHRTRECLERVRSWMVPGGVLRVEVPDVAELCRMDLNADWWQQWMFGSQHGPGKTHLAGFTTVTLHAALTRAGWCVGEVRAFKSTNVNRIGYPCLEARATA